MKSKQGKAAFTPILAAGGIVVGQGANADKIVVIHRTRYGPEIALPKGKLTSGESPLEAAVREVGEDWL